MGNSSSSSRQGLFRNGSYQKSVTLGKRRIKGKFCFSFFWPYVCLLCLSFFFSFLNSIAGECCAIWDGSGNVRNVLGPKLELVNRSPAI